MKALLRPVALAPRLVRRVYSIVLVLALWEWVASTGRVNTFLLPPVSAVLRNFWLLLTDGQLAYNLTESLIRVGAGLSLALVVGIPLGLLMARNRAVQGFLDPIFSFGFPVPKVGLIPAALLFFGLGHGSKIALVFLDALLPIVISTYHGALHVDRRLVWSARAMGDTDLQILRRVVFPAALPQIFTGLRLAVTISLLVVFLAEMVASSSGLGHVMIYSLRTLATLDVFSTLLAISLLAFALDWLVLRLRAWALAWHG